jgi:hypothetical protein
MQAQSWQSASFSPVVEIGTPPTPHPQASVPPFPSGGEGHTSWREREWESPNSDEGTYTVVLFTYPSNVLSSTPFLGKTFFF